MMIENRWSDAEAAGMSDLDLLVYQSRLLGSDSRLVLWGGGNTSLKVQEEDFRGRPTYVLRVKGSGSDLKSVTQRDFPGVRIDDVLPLMERDDMSDEEMVEYLTHTLMDPSSPRPSIETLLHAFVPARSVVHSHADAILALTNNERCDALLAEVYGDELAIVPYRRPGFLLSKQVGMAVHERPDIKGVVLLNHGLITWHNDPREAYRLHIEIVDRAARYAASPKFKVQSSKSVIYHASRVTHHVSPTDRHTLAVKLAPILRGLLGKEKRVVVHFDGSEDARRFVSGEVVPLDRMVDVLEAGAATPDHILNTKRTPLWIEAGDLSSHALREAATGAFSRWVEQYAAYYARHNRGEGMLPAVPRVVLVRDVGMFSVGKDRRAVTISGDISRHTMEIIEASEEVGRYRSLSHKDAFAAEYWPLELYKLTLAPPEKSLSRRVAMVTGAAGAIGAGIARRLASEGAHVVCADLNMERAGALAQELSKANPNNPALPVFMDVTQEASVRDAYREMILEYGGIDVLVSNAGIAKSCPLDELTLVDWERSLAVNATGHFLVAREALRIMKAQGIGGSMVFIATKNVTAPGKDFGAYSASKAAEAQLARVLALEGGPYGIRSNVVNPDAVFAGSGLWSQEVREQRARAQGIDPDEIEEYYRQRNLLQVEVTAADVAEAVLFYASDRSAKTTGSMLPVDGGLREAFPR
ncbi:MAG TPA: bifunctional rhamnulose-1-phosphate aldolase/short-chain dehydrogenase [Chloroflexia bacterium]|nr:bifunctional rhamnulose-1-phosphate aldolase/short-chain dehydrogenase [Chloroflexia bacterium]